MDQNILLSKLTCIHGRLLNHPKLQRSFRNCFQMLIVSGGFSGQAILASTEVKKSPKKKKTQCPGLGLYQPWQGMEVCGLLTHPPLRNQIQIHKHKYKQIHKYTGLWALYPSPSMQPGGPMWPAFSIWRADMLVRSKNTNVVFVWKV